MLRFLILSYLGILSSSCTCKFLASSTSTLISTTPYLSFTFPWRFPSSLALVQLIVWMKKIKVHSHLSGRGPREPASFSLAFPVLTGLLVPTVTWMPILYQLKVIIFHWRQGAIPNQANQEGTTTQYLRPDTSSYFTSSAYEKEMTKELAKLQGT